jgi:hypothetical protein
MGTRVLQADEVSSNRTSGYSHAASSATASCAVGTCATEKPRALSPCATGSAGFPGVRTKSTLEPQTWLYRNSSLSQPNSEARRRETLALQSAPCLSSRLPRQKEIAPLKPLYPDRACNCKTFFRGIVIMLQKMPAISAQTVIGPRYDRITFPNCRL